MTLYANTFFQIISLFYVILIGIVFLVKKKVESAENSIFKNLILVSITCCILDIVSIVTAYLMPNEFTTILFAKCYLLTLIGFSIIYTEYAIIITNTSINNEQKLEQFHKLRNIILGIFALIALAVLIAPIQIMTQGTDVMYTYGPATTITYLVSGTCILLWTSLLIVRVKHLAARKTLPIVAVVVLGGLATLIQLFHPEILLVTAAMSFSTVIMYFSVFTLENPDLEMVEEIKSARNAAIKASNAKTDFLSNMSHELRTPLNAILGFSQGLLDQNLEPSMKEDVEDIVSASETLLELVNEILDISKIESDKFEIIDIDYSVNKMYRYLVTMTEGRIGSRQLDFIHEYDNDIPPVLNGDCVRIKQVVVNLLTNSVKYTKEGYVKLSMSFEKDMEDSGVLMIKVSDSGIGIKDEDMQRLFSKFSRLDLKKNINIEGTGLGLALTKKLVDLMHGEIKVESKYGVGTTFTVKIRQKIVNKKVEEVEDTNPLQSRQSFKGNGQKVLVVDDNNVNLKVATRLLKNYNLVLDYASSGKECIDKIVKNHYDLVLLDDQMPEMTGTEVIKHLREIGNYKIPTIALTANAISGMKEKYLQSGFDGYLSKPIDKILLEEMLMKFLPNPEEIKEEPKETPLKKEIIPQVEEYLEDPVEELLEEEPIKNKREYLEENGIDVKEALETLGDMDIYNETAKDVYEEIDNKMSNLEKYMENEELENYSVIAHALKGDARYLGMKELTNLAYNHELAGKEENIEYIHAHYEELVNEANKMRKVLKNYLGK